MPNSNFEDKKISVIIVNFRSDQYLKKCIASLYNFENAQDLEIIIVNNEPEKNLAEKLMDYPEVLIINNEKNRGFGQAVNIGAEKTQGEILFFLNPDTETQEASFSQIQEKFLKDSSLAVLSPKIIDAEGKKQEWTFGKKLTFWQLVKNNLCGERKKEELAEKKVDWVSGAGMFVRKAAFFEVGGFDEKFFMYFEDMDLCLRLGKLGKKILYFPKIRIKHRENGSILENKERKEKYYASQDYYFQKHRGNFEFWLVRIVRKILK